MEGGRRNLTGLDVIEVLGKDCKEKLRKVNFENHKIHYQESMMIYDLVLSFHLLIFEGYFECMRLLLNNKVPSSLERSHVAPTPVAASIYELVMNPISYAATCKDTQFR